MKWEEFVPLMVLLAAVAASGFFQAHENLAIEHELSRISHTSLSVSCEAPK